MAKEQCAKCGGKLGGLLKSVPAFTFTDGKPICHNCYWQSSFDLFRFKRTFAEFNQHLGELETGKRVFQALFTGVNAKSIMNMVPLYLAPELGLLVFFSIPPVKAIKPKGNQSEARYMVYRYADVLEYSFKQDYAGTIPDPDNVFDNGNPGTWNNMLTFRFDNPDNHYVITEHSVSMAPAKATEVINHFNELLSGDRSELAQKADAAIKSVIG